MPLPCHTAFFSRSDAIAYTLLIGLRRRYAAITLIFFAAITLFLRLPLFAIDAADSLFSLPFSFTRCRRPDAIDTVTLSFAAIDAALSHTLRMPLPCRFTLITPPLLPAHAAADAADVISLAAAAATTYADTYASPRFLLLRYAAAAITF